MHLHDHRIHVSCDVKKKVLGGLPTRSDINWAVQSQKMARCLKF